MLEGCSLEDCAGFAALADEPGEVDCCVDAYRGEDLGVVDSGRELVFWESSELWVVRDLVEVRVVGAYIRHYVFVPWVRIDKGREPLAGCAFLVFLAIVDDRLCNGG